MRDQYAGDVSDVLKFAFLRTLTSTDRKLGVAWYYVPDHDGRTDGRHLEWRTEPAWLHLDKQLHAGLSTLPQRSVDALQRAAIWPHGVKFYKDAIPERTRRSAWGESKRASLDGADLVFLDPDNGLGKATRKHATYSELQLLRRPGRAIAFISFPGRNKSHPELLSDMHERVRMEAGAENVVTLTTSVSVPSKEENTYIPRLRWFTIVDPDADLIARARTFVSSLASVPRVRAQLHS
jgi:hypothetical protein